MSVRPTHCCPSSNVHAALREAARALEIARTAGTPVQERAQPVCRIVAADVAATLEAMAGLVRSAGYEAVPTSPGSHSLHALVQHLGVGVSMARRSIDGDGDGTGSLGARTA